MSVSAKLREILHDLRGILLQRLLMLALKVAPPGGTADDLAATLHDFFQRELVRMRDARE